MKRRHLLLTLTAASSLLAASASSACAQSIRLLTQITGIIPSEASAGQIITVKLTQNDLALSSVLGNLRPFPLPKFAGRFPGLAGAQTTKIFFTGASAGSFVEAQNLLRINDDTYTVRVPAGARSGPMRLQMGAATSLSQVSFTLASVGFSFANESQFNLVSVKIDNVERLAPGQIVAAVPATSTNVNWFDVGTTVGSHTVQVTLGIDAARPILVLPLGTLQASTFIGPNQGFNNPIPLRLMLGGQYLASSPNLVAVSGASRTVSWQAVEVQATGGVVIHGFDFTFNATTGATTFKHWIGDRSRLTGQGTLVEPTATQWGNNFPAVNLPLRLANGSPFATITVNLLNASLTASDGLTYDMQ